MFAYKQSALIYREISGQNIHNEKDCLKAIGIMHNKGVKTVIVTSGLEEENLLFCYGSSINGLPLFLFFNFSLSFI